jgi:hypothetical protein
MKNLLLISFICLISSKIIAQDMYLEYKMSGIMPGMDGINKMYVSSNSGLRMEMDMKMPQVGNMTTVTIIPKGKNITYSYNSMSKTYVESQLDSKTTLEAEKNMKFELVGKEKIGPYNCTHIRMLIGKQVASDMWVTKDIAGYQVMETLTKSSSNFGSNKIYLQMKAAGADGLMVKMDMNVGSKKMVNQLVKAEKRTNPASLFVMPAGYTKMDLSKLPKGIPKL